MSKLTETISNIERMTENELDGYIEIMQDFYDTYNCTELFILLHTAKFVQSNYRFEAKLKAMNIRIPQRDKNAGPGSYFDLYTPAGGNHK